MEFLFSRIKKSKFKKLQNIRFDKKNKSAYHVFALIFKSLKIKINLFSI